MKTRALILLFAASSALAQGTFQNLDFESAVIVPIAGTDHYVELAPALPGWTGYLETNQVGAVLFNDLNIGEPALALLGPGYNPAAIITGSFTAVLQAGSRWSSQAGSFINIDASISQTGSIPVGTRSIRFIAWGARNGFTVSLNGQQIPMTVLGTQGIFDILGGDVSLFAGLTEELRFTALSAPSSPANLYVDAIEFSASAIPEPSALTLSAIGTVLLIWRFLRRTRP